MNTFNNLVSAVGQPFAGQMLVWQGSGDTIVPQQGISANVNAPCEAVLGADIQFEVFKGADHFPTLFASQQVRLDWIADVCGVYRTQA